MNNRIRGSAGAVIAACLLGTACGGAGDPDDLAPQAVTRIAPGNATGIAASGRYAISLKTIACSGPCPVAIDVLGLFVVHYCENDWSYDYRTDVKQSDGNLRIDVEPPLLGSAPVGHLDGGIELDARFEIGGAKTDEQGKLVTTMRAQG